MKTLPIHFTESGFTHRQLDRCSTAAIYKRFKNPENPHWEVIKVRVQKVNNVVTEEYEVYPGAVDWGAMGLTFSGPSGQEQAFEEYRLIAEGRPGARLNRKPGGQARKCFHDSTTSVPSVFTK